MRLQRFGDLDVHVSGGSDGQGGGDGPLVVLLHGFGAPGTDLVPLAEALALPAPVRFAFPAAPIELSAFWGESRAWWMLDMDRLEQAMASGQRVDFSDEVPVGMAEARERVLAMLEALRTDLDATAAPLILGGFSQGAMLSCDIALRTDLALTGLVVLSGTLLCAEEWRAAMPARAGLPVFQSHGRSDPLLPFETAERLHDLMTQAGLQVSWHTFSGGHEIPALVLRELAGFLRARL